MPRTNNSRPRREFEYSVPVEFPLPDNDSATQSQHSDTRSNQRRRRRQNNADHGHPASTRRSEQHFPLGTREDVQQDDYVSPIFGMFNRAWGRYRDAEDARQAARQVDTYQTNVDSRPRQTQLQQLMEDPSLQRGMEQMLLQGARAEIERNVRNNTAAQDVQHDVNVVPQNVEHPPQGRNLRDSYVHRGDTPELTSPPRLNPLVPALPLARSQSTTTGVIRNRRGNFHAQFYSSPFDPPMRALDHRRFIDLSNDDPSDRISAIDRQRSRPEPSRPEDLKVDFGCKSCQEQKIDSISMPCMHASMCHWCAEIWKEACRTDDGRFDRSLWTCPICRRQISEMRRFYIWMLRNLSALSRVGGLEKKVFDVWMLE